VPASAAQAHADATAATSANAERRPTWFAAALGEATPASAASATSTRTPSPLDQMAAAAQAASATAPAQAPVASAPAAPPAAATPAASTFPPFADQVSKPVFALATAGDGTHTVTISVTPDNLGPVTVRAHISGENMRIELFSPSDSGRDALRQLLPDLRRDLTATGANANLDLSSQGQPDAQQNPGTLREDPRSQGPEGGRTDRVVEAVGASAPPVHLSRAGSPAGLDVMA
jgi:flagellar hook-length control protein FliK